MENVMILGGGISGVTAAYYLKKKGVEASVFEKNNEAGGLCRSFIIDGFCFDYGAHCSFSKNREVRDYLEGDTEYAEMVSQPLNYKNGKWIRHPVQNNLFKLDTEEKIKIISGFVNRESKECYEDYEEWLKGSYGEYFAEEYPCRYTRKYWTLEAREMGVDWIGPRMYVPRLEEMLRGAFQENTENVHYSGQIRYPKTGGFAGFLEPIISQTPVITKKEVVRIDSGEKKVYFLDGTLCSYDYLISTLPLDIICRCMTEIPDPVRLAAEGLAHTSLVLVSVGLKKEIKQPEMFYIYDEDIMTVRAYSTCKYGGKNAPEGCTTLQMETYFSKYKPLDRDLEQIKQRAIQDCISMGVFGEQDVICSDVRLIEYANVIFTKDIDKKRRIIHKYLEENGIFCAGRFAEWDYLWTDQSILSAKAAVNKILDELNGEESK